MRMRCTYSTMLLPVAWRKRRSSVRRPSATRCASCSTVRRSV
ncbi:Uncharacterised protein [Bordetella pertussis]|nr:Uncharacterised protein [Bordetella pertussis]